MRREASIPSIPGSRQSISTRSKGWPTCEPRVSADRASSAEETARARKPLAWTMASSRFRALSLSSTIST